MWYPLYLGICILTWLGGALLFFLLSPILGILALGLAVLLTESLLCAYRAEKAAVADRKALRE